MDMIVLLLLLVSFLFICFIGRETLYPDHKHYMSLVLKIALLQVSNGQVDGKFHLINSDLYF